ncbi:MAG: class I SAM-dependent methyltransferase [Thermoleophilaceae bacterium]
MGEKLMRGFWEERAQEQPLYFIDNTLDYRRPDAERFFEHGEETLDRMLDLLGAAIEPKDTVLEIGCGAGRQTRAIAARAAEVAALDISERMLDLARELSPELSNVRWLLGDGTSLSPVPDRSVDACVSYVVFQHLPDAELTLGYVREIGRVLRPGGWAAFQVSNDFGALHRRRRGREGLRIRLKALVGRGPRGQAHPAWLGSPVRMDDLARAAGDGGMDIERVEGAGSQLCFVLTRAR